MIFPKSIAREWQRFYPLTGSALRSQEEDLLRLCIISPSNRCLSQQPLPYALLTFLQRIPPCVSGHCSEEGPEEKPTCRYPSRSRLCFHVSHPLCCLTFDLLYFASSPPLHHLVHYLSSLPLPAHQSLPFYFLKSILISLLYLWNHGQGQHFLVPKMVQAHYRPSLTYNLCVRGHMELRYPRNKKCHMNCWA